MYTFVSVVRIPCLFVAALCLLAPPAAAEQGARIDSLITLGKSLFEVGEAEQAVKLFDKALKLDSEQVEPYLRLGRAYIEAGELRDAGKAFKKALERNDASAEAQTGIAEVHYRQTSEGLMAMYHTRKAVSEARRATRIGPDYAPAYLLLGRSYERLNENYEAALRAYTTALKLQPDDLETALLLGRAYIELQRRPRRDRTVLKSILDGPTLRRLERHLGEPEFLPVAAQIYFDRGDAEKALLTFEEYVESLPGAEQAHYRDIGPVATRGEVEAYERTPEAEREEFLRQFWARRDLDLLTEVNERLFEHYRRVWYARKHFGEKVTPWDSRGEIYVRYGDPDHRAYSDRPPPPMSAAVEQVKERLALALYGPESMDESFTGPVYPVRSSESFVGILDPSAIGRVDDGETLFLGQEDADAEDDLIIDTPEDEPIDGGAYADAIQEFMFNDMKAKSTHQYLPVTTRGDMTVVSWESWVYANVAEGIEITFTDEIGNGIYKYAPIPDFPAEEGSVGFHRYSQLAYYAPQAIAERSMAEIPDFFTPGGPMSGLGFSYDFADFRAPDGATRLEVYYALDPAEMGAITAGDTSSIITQCDIILADTTYSKVYRAHDTLHYRAVGYRKWPEGSFIPNIVTIDVPPGDYLLTVQANDWVAKRKGLYRHRVHIEPYDRDSLRISDIQLSWNISSEGGDKKFKKGDVWVVPMTTRAYREDQSAYVYYELYNLARDRFGEARYRITYTIGAEDPVRPFNLVRSSIGALAGIFKKKKPQVRVSFEQTGSESSPTGYFELSLDKVKPGHNRLTVNVEDLNSGQIAAKEIQFRCKK